MRGDVISSSSGGAVPQWTCNPKAAGLIPAGRLLFCNASPAFSFSEYDPLVVTSPAAESIPKKHCRLVTSPISPASVDQSNFYSSAYVTSAQ